MKYQPTVAQMGSCSPSPAQEAEIPYAAERLYSNIGRVQDRLEQLTQKLAPILHDIPPSNTAGVTAARPMTSPAGRMISEAADRLTIAHDQVIAILDRLAL